MFKTSNWKWKLWNILTVTVTWFSFIWQYMKKIISLRTLLDKDQCFWISPTRINQLFAVTLETKKYSIEGSISHLIVISETYLSCKHIQTWLLKSTTAVQGYSVLKPGLVECPLQLNSQNILVTNGHFQSKSKKAI